MASYHNIDDGFEASQAFAAYADGLPQRRLKQLAREALEAISFETHEAHRATAKLARIAIHLPLRMRMSCLESILERQYPGHISTDVLVGIGLLAESIPPNGTEDAWNAVLQALTNEDLFSDEDFLQATFQLASCIPKAYLLRLLDFIDLLENPSTRAMALWALAPFISGESLKRATNVATNLARKGPGLLGFSAVIARSRNSSRISEVGRLLRASDHDDPFLTPAIASLLPAAGDEERTALSISLLKRLETLVEHYRFVIAAYSQLALLSNEAAVRRDHWRSAFLAAAREGGSSHIVRWLATQGPAIFTVSNELEAINATAFAMSTINRGHGFELLEAIEPLARGAHHRKLHAAVRGAIEAVRVWWP